MNVTLIHPDGTEEFFPDVSAKLDQAWAMEEYHREQFLWWKQRHQWLEGQIPVESPFRDFIETLDDDANTKKKRKLDDDLW